MPVGQMKQDDQKIFNLEAGCQNNQKISRTEPYWVNYLITPASMMY